MTETVPHNKKTAADLPIGIFDSGIGGLTVLKEVSREIPAEEVVYFGDTARVPYGTKSKETITKFSFENIHFLQNFNVKIVIVACNTASSLSLEALKQKFDLPIIGVIEPGARSAIQMTKNGRVGVIGTKATISSGAYENSLKRLDASVKVYSQACPLFVPFAEEGWFDGDVVSKVARAYLDGMKSFKIDTLILGCTHYPLLAKVIQKTLGRRVKLVNSAEETAKEAAKLLVESGLCTEKKKNGPKLRFYVSDEPEQFRANGERFLGMSIRSVVKVADHFRSPGFDRRASAGQTLGASGEIGEMRAEN